MFSISPTYFHIAINKICVFSDTQLSSTFEHVCRSHPEYLPWPFLVIRILKRTSARRILKSVVFRGFQQLGVTQIISTCLLSDCKHVIFQYSSAHRKLREEDYFHQNVRPEYKLRRPGPTKQWCYMPGCTPGNGCTRTACPCRVRTQHDAPGGKGNAQPKCTDDWASLYV